MFNLKRFRLGILVLCIIMVINTLPGAGFITKANGAVEYPYQAVRIENVNKGWNVNILGYNNNAEVNVWPTNGESNERWRFATTDGTNFKLINEKTGLLLTPLNWSVTEGNGCVLYADSGREEQLWQIIGVDRDVNGDMLYYKIVNKTNTNMALVINLSTDKTMLSAYKGNSTHKWKLVSDGLVGYAAYAKDLNGKEKTGTIGGLLGKTVFVNNLNEFKNALLDPNPLTIVIASNIDNCNTEVYDLRIASNKTIIGSYGANRLTDPRLRTDDYFKKEGVSNNIIIKNLDIAVSERKNVVSIAVYGSRNIWIDHCSFNSKLGIDVAEVGKFVWVNTSTYTDTDPDYVTLSYNRFANRYWTVAFGTKTGLNKNNATVMFNYFDSCVRRTPQSGNGKLHVLNNLIKRTYPSLDDAGYAAIIGGEGAEVYSDANRFHGFKKASSGYWDTEIVIDAKASVKDVDSYTNKGEAAPVSTPYVLPAPNGTVTSYKPSVYYNYPIMKAYDTTGNDVMSFCTAYTGEVSSATGLKYIHYPEFKGYLK